MNKMKHWKKIPKSAGHVGLPSSGPYFQTKIVQPIIIPSNINGIKIDRKMSFAPNPSPWLFVSFNEGACYGYPSEISKNAHGWTP